MGEYNLLWWFYENENEPILLLNENQPILLLNENQPILLLLSVKEATKTT